MPTTYTDLIADVRKAIRVVTLDDIKQRLEAKTPMVLLDVREKEEYRAGYIPGAISVPRGFLEMQIEQKVPDKSAPIVAYCAGGTRSALAAKTLQELGYTNVESANPGFVRWKDLGFPMEMPPQLTDAQRDRYSRPRRCSSSARSALAAPPRSTSRRPASGRSGWSTPMWSTRRTCSARSSMPRRASACRRSRAPSARFVI
jgi:rhodanese-related sulfurtransferase